MTGKIRSKSVWMMFVKSFEGVQSKALRELQARRPELDTRSEVWGSFGWGKRWFSSSAHSEEYELLEKAMLGLEISVDHTPVIWPSDEGLIYGSFDHLKLQIHLPQEKFWIFAHEAAHAADYLIEGDVWSDEPRSVAQRELVASAAGYLLTSERLGVYDPSAEVSYAKYRGATREDLRLLEGRIKGVADRLSSLMKSER